MEFEQLWPYIDTESKISRDVLDMESRNRPSRTHLATFQVRLSTLSFF